MAKDMAAHIERALAPLAASHGLELWTVEVAGSAGRPLVRVYLDRTGGIDIDTIAAANAWISQALDSLQDLAGPYVLEVSSPGIQRPLRKPADFRRFVGSVAEVKTKAPIDGRKSFTGAIEAAGDDELTLAVDGATLRLGYDDISKARLHADFDFTSNATKE